MKAVRAVGVLTGIIVALCSLSTYGDTVDLSSTSADFTLFSRDAGDLLGSFNALAMGDFNDDGRLDFLIGAPGGDGPTDSRSNAGEAYIIFGKANLPNRVDVDGIPGPDVIIYGSRLGEQLGSSVAAGDVNGDGIDDIILGAPGDNFYSFGAVYILLGGAALSPRIDLSDTTADVSVINSSVVSRFGSAVLTWDLNGDSIKDLIIGDPAARTQAGRVFVIFGRADLPRRIDMGAAGGPDVSILGIDTGDHMGTSLSAGDFNNDGITDLAIGAPSADGPGNRRNNGGEVYIIYGDSLPRTLDLAATSPDVVIFGRDAGDRFGSSVAMGDVNGDRIPDLIVGAPEANGPNNRRGGAGDTYVFLGATTLPSVMDAREDANVVIYGPSSLDKLGSAVAAGDFNGDGIADIALGAANARSSTGRAQAGNAFLLHGRRNWPASLDLNSTDPNRLFLGANAGDRLGSGVALGSGRGDGRAALLLGAPGADDPGDGDNAGVVYLFTGAKKAPENRAPTARAGDDRTVTVDTQVRLDGSGSSDPDGDSLTFSWTFVSRPQGSGAQLANADTAKPAFTPDVVGEYLIELTVDDGRGGTDNDRVRITAREAPPEEEKGDVDGDGQITILDARLVCEAVLGDRTLSQAQRERADVAPPFGELTLEDARYIAEAAVGKRTLGGSSAASSSSVSVPLNVLSWEALAHGDGTLEFRATGVGIESIRVEVFNLAGQSVFGARTWGSRLSWHPHNAHGQPLANGIYFYAVTVRGVNGEIQRSDLRKLVVLR